MSLTHEQSLEIKELKENKKLTQRTSVDELEDILYEVFPVLDHGFVRVVDYMGDDAAVVQAARVSYGRGTKKALQDKGLINYLMRHRHTTPFEMCEIKLHVKLPIFIARHWVRHRTASINEYSARYSILDKEFYIPTKENLRAQSTVNKQGRGSAVSEDEAENVLQVLKNDALGCYEHYEQMLNIDHDGNIIDEGKTGVARELARMNLPVNIYTQWYWKTNLHNLMHFLALRADVHAQYEIRCYANVILDILKKWVPMTYEAFMDYRMKSEMLSGKGVDITRKLLKGENITQENSGMSKGEWRELMGILNLSEEAKPL